MLEKLLVWERDLFFTLHGHHTPYWDNVMWLFSGQIVWLPLAAFLLAALFYQTSWRESLAVLLGIVLVITLSDQFASHLCKPLFMRFRPTHHPDFMDQIQTVYGYRGGLYGFISSHAANAFGFAMFMALLFRRRVFTWTIFCWAAVMAYTRIYLGVHFISDIVPGAIAGCVFGILTYYIYVHARKILFDKGGREVIPAGRIYPEKRVWMIVGAIWLTIGIILLFPAGIYGIICK